jgi:outer membrane protein assembly factor BamB
MRYKTLAPIVWISLLVSFIVAQNDAGLLRGNPGRTGEFDISGPEAFGTLLWKSPRIVKIETDDRYRARIHFVLESLTYDQTPFLSYPPRFPVLDNGKETMPLIYHDAVFFTRNVFSPDIGDGFVISLNVNLGKQNWSYKCRKCYVSDPVAYKDWIIVISKNFGKKTEGKIEALNILTGKPDWSVPVDRVSLVEPTLDNGVLYFTRGESYIDWTIAQSADAAIYALDLNTRTMKWGFETKGIFDTPAIAKGILFAASNKDYLYAIDKITGKEKWRFRANAHGPIAKDGVVYFSDYSNLYAVDALNGDLKWKQKVTGRIATPLAISKSMIFYGSDGKFCAIYAATGEQK